MFAIYVHNHTGQHISVMGPEHNTKNTLYKLAPGGTMPTNYQGHEWTFLVGLSPIPRVNALTRILHNGHFNLRGTGLYEMPENKRIAEWRLLA